MARMKKQTMLFNVAIVAVTAVITLGLLGYLTPRENVNFLMNASFTYRGSEDNGVIENIVLRFPLPNVENKAITSLTTWVLYWMDNDNALYPEMYGDAAGPLEFYEFRGQRDENLGILIQCDEPSAYGPKAFFKLDKIYPNEVLFVITEAMSSKDVADKVTLKYYGDDEGRSMAYEHSNEPDYESGKAIDLYFWAQLSRSFDNENRVIETFSRSVDNAASGWWWWLYE